MGFQQGLRSLLGRVIAIVSAVAGMALLSAAVQDSADEPRVLVGEPAPFTAIADRPIRVEDKAATAAARSRAADEVEPVLVYARDVQTEMVAAVDEIFSALLAARESGEAENIDGSAGTEDQWEELGEIAASVLSDEGLHAVATLSEEELEQVWREVADLAQQLGRLRITAGDVQEILSERLPSELARRPLSNDVARLVARPIIAEILRPTATVDVERTMELKNQALMKVRPVVETWQAGEPVIQAGQNVSPGQRAALEHVGHPASGSSSRHWRLLRAAVLLVLVPAASLLTTGMARRARPAAEQRGSSHGESAETRLAVGLLVVVACIGVVLITGVVVPWAVASNDRRTPEEQAVADHARSVVEEMQSTNWFQPAVTIAVEVDVWQVPSSVPRPPAPPCDPEQPERGVIARVEAQGPFGIPLWTYDVTCNGTWLVTGI